MRFFATAGILLVIAGATAPGAAQERTLNIRQQPAEQTREQTLVTRAVPPPSRNCGVIETEKTRGMLASARVEPDEIFEQWMRQTVQEARGLRLARSAGPQVFTLPVVVHVVYSSAEENISDEQVYSQIRILNEDYRRRNPDRSLTPYAFQAVAADTEIEFCLAGVDPRGNPTNGIDRISIPGSPFSEKYINEQIKPATIWDPERYMNIWVCHIANQMLGFAQFPASGAVEGLPAGSTAAETDGVVISYIAFGSLGTAQPPFNHGRTATHEVGHWLGLRHIWGDGPCGVDDYCKDTPEIDGPLFGCPSANAFGCGGALAQTTNFMDYADDACMNLFTLEQKMRMRAVIEYSPRRKELLSSDVCRTSQPPAPPEFMADIQTGCTPLTVRFTAIHLPPGATVYWSFPGGRPASSSDPQPRVIYRESGAFPVTLRVTNAQGVQTVKKDAFIQAMSRGRVLPLQFFAEKGDPQQQGFTTRAGAYEWTVTPAVDAFGGSGSALAARRVPGGAGPAWLVSPQLDLASGAQPAFSFDYAYAPGSSSLSDSLGIFVATGCNAEFEAIYFQGGNQLATSQPDESGLFLPRTDQWKSVAVDLSPFARQENVQVAVIFYGAGGSIYLDNLAFGAKSLPPPVANFSFSDERICQGGTVSFSDQSAHHPVRWLWSFPGGAPATDTTPNPVVRYDQPGIYEVALTVWSPAGTHTTVREAAIAVQAATAPQLTASRTELCLGEEARLLVKGLSGPEWYQNGVRLPFTGSEVRVSPIEDAMYQVRGISEQGCAATVSIVIRVRQERELAVMPGKPVICAGGEIELTASGADTYVWSPVEGLSPASGARVIARPLRTTTYQVTGERASGCVLKKSITVTVEDAAVLAISPSYPKICEGEAITLQASGGSAYQWSPASEVNHATGSSVSLRPSQTTLLEVKALSIHGCEVTKKVRVEVAPRPRVLLRVFPEQACQGEQVELFAAGARSYAWYPEGLPFEEHGPVTNLRAESSVQIRVVGTNEAGCRDTSDANLIVTPLPQVRIATLTPTVCPGQPANLSARGAASYVWMEQPDILSAQGAEARVRLSRQRQTFRVMGRDDNGCESASEITLQQATSDAPAPDFTTRPGYYCAGQPIEFVDLSQNAIAYLWEFPGGNPSFSREPNPVIQYAEAGVYDVSLSTRGCNGEARKEKKGWLVVNTGQGISLNAGDQTICRGEPFRLAAFGGSNYKWLPAPGLIWSAGAEATVSPSRKTTYTVSGLDADGCQVQASVTLDVTPPRAPVRISPLAPVMCEGDNVVLTASGSLFYKWYPQRGLNRYDGSEVVAYPQATTRYMVEATDAFGCVARDTVVVTVAPNPAVHLTASRRQVCAGDTVQLSVSDPGVAVWSGPGIGAQYGPVLTTALSQSGRYEVRLTRPNGCLATGFQELIVESPGPFTVTASDREVCRGEKVILSALGSTASLTWTPAGPLDKSTGGLVQARMEKTTSFTVRSGTGQCAIERTLTVEVRQPKELEVQPALVRICKGQSQTLTAQQGSGWYWDPAPGLISSTGASVQVKPVSTTRYVVRGNDASGCPSSGSALVVVDEPTAYIAASKAIACAGEPVLLEARGGVSYRWIAPDGSLLPASGSKLQLESPAKGAYRMVASNETGCIDSASISLEFRDLKPDFRMSATNIDLATTTGGIQFQDLTPSAASWQWDFGDGGYSNERNPFHVYAQPGTYAVSLRVSDGACTQSISKPLQVTNSSSLAELEQTGRIAVEADDLANWVDIDIQSPRPMQLLLVLRNQQGVSVLEGVLRLPKGQFSDRLLLSELAAGNYTLQLTDGAQLLAFPVAVN